MMIEKITNERIEKSYSTPIRKLPRNQQILEWAKFAYAATQQKLQTHHSTKIEDATIALFKVCKDSPRYNSHLFFPNKPTKHNEEKNCQVENFSSLKIVKVK